MNFTSSIFLFIFLPISILLFYITPKRIKKYTLLAISVAFYVYAASFRTFLLMLGIAVLNYVIGILINKYQKKLILIIGILINILSLFLYKYTNFTIGSINNIFSTNIKLLELILPLGISFIIFQNISYLVDIYKKKYNSEKNIISFLLYVFFFPKIVSGPITRYENFKFNLDQNKIDNLYYGIKRISYGLGKVLILSAAMEKIWTTAEPTFTATPAVWLGIICYSLHLFLNFSGYMDIALGLGKIFCIELPENFNYPYTAESISDFWRRWHISLSSWFRDYVYIPLGGNRKGNVYFNLFIVFLLTGLWHGASLNYIIWGVYNGVWIIIERLIRDKTWYKKIPKIAKQIFTYFIILLGWVLFSTASLEKAGETYICLFGIKAIENVQFNLLYFLTKYNICFLTISILTVLPFKNIFIKRIKNEKTTEIISGNFALIIFAISIMYLINNSYTPSLYAQF